MIVGYIRVSTEKQHPENQENEIRSFAKDKGWTINKWTVEIVSGKKQVKGRKLGGLLRRLKKGDTIIVTEISRLSRSLTEIMTLMGKCISRGINIYTTKEKYCFDDSINSKVLCFAFGLVAEIERNLISMRTKEALALRKSEGKILGRRIGFCPKMTLLENSKDLIVKMLKDGVSHKEIYTQLGVSKSSFYKFKSQLYSPF